MLSRSSFKKTVLIFGLLAGLFVVQPAAARKFDMKNEVFATYFGATYGPSNISDSAFGRASSAGVSTDQIVRSNFSGELGIVLFREPFALRIGGEYVFGRNLNDVVGRDAANVEFFELDSKTRAFVLGGAIETTFARGNESRLYFGAGAGAAFVSLDQEYRMTTTGAATLGLGNYSEKGSTEALMWRVYLGGEVLLIDTTTILLELGYRNLVADELKSTKDTAAMSGQQTTGSTLLNTDGTNRRFDMGGAYGGISFRFYL